MNNIDLHPRTLRRNVDLTRNRITVRRPLCCELQMRSHGPDRFRCVVCRKTKVKIESNWRENRRWPIVSDYQIDIPLPISSVVTSNPKGRLILSLGVNHALANSAGWQYLARYVVMVETGEKLGSDEHVHHNDGVLKNCRRDNLEVWLAKRHGRYHARNQLLYMLRDKVSGRFVKSNVPSFDVQYDTIQNSNVDYLSDIPF